MQVVSSAIMNAPPPMGVVSVLHTCSNAHMSGIDNSTKEKMVSGLRPLLSIHILPVNFMTLGHTICSIFGSD